MLRKFASVVSAGVLLFTLIPTIGLAADRNQVLQIGDEDIWVMELQQKLNETGYLVVPATGYFGTDTQNAIVSFQLDNNLNADGKADPQTRELILGDEYEVLPDDRVVNTNSLTVQSEIVGTAAQASSTGLSPGDKGSEISTAQERLTEYEYYEYGNITGFYGPVTEDAVKKFQRTHNLAQTGILDSTSLELLYSDEIMYYTIYPGDSGDDIIKMQDKLRELGYYSGESTGFYGDATLTAVKIFQDDNGLSVDGKVGKSTRELLYGQDSVTPSATPTPSPSPTPTNTGTSATAAPETDVETEAPAPVATPQPTVTPTVAPTPAPTQPPTSSSTGVSQMLSVANSQIGIPYSYGANGPSAFDCSGFIYYVLRNSGVAVSRLSSAGYASLSNWTTISDVGSLAVGDLVFFKSDSSSSISHMGLYLGGGSFIHSAPSSGGVAVSGMSTGYYARNFVTAKRIF